MSPVGFQSQGSWRLIFHVQVLKVGMPFWATSPQEAVQFSSVAQSCPTLCDPKDCTMPGFPVHHQLLELTQTHAIESVMPSNQFILYYPLLLQPSTFPRIRVFSNESVLHIRWSKYQEASGSRDGVYGEIGSQTLLLLCCGLFLIFCIWRRCSASFQDLFRGNYPIYSYIFYGLWEEVTSESSYIVVLNCLPYLYFLKSSYSGFFI